MAGSSASSQCQIKLEAASSLGIFWLAGRTGLVLAPQAGGTHERRETMSS